MMSARAWVLLMVLAFIWGGTFFLTEILLTEMRPFQIVFHRVALAAIVMYAYIKLKGLSLPLDLKNWAVWGVMGVLNNALPFSAIVFGQQYITAGLASILNAATAFFGVIIAAIILSDERITIPKLTGVILGIIGVAIIIGVENLAQLSLTNIGQYLIILAAISYALAGVWGRLFINNTSVEVTVTGMLISSSVFMLILAFAIEGNPVEIISTQSILATIAFAIICTNIAYLLYFNILAEAGASNLMLVTIIIPAFAIILDAIFFGEFISNTDLIGFAIIAVGLLVISGRIKMPKLN